MDQLVAFDLQRLFGMYLLQRFSKDQLFQGRFLPSQLDCIKTVCLPLGSISSHSYGDRLNRSAILFFRSFRECCSPSLRYSRIGWCNSKCFGIMKLPPYFIYINYIIPSGKGQILLLQVRISRLGYSFRYIIIFVHIP